MPKTKAIRTGDIPCDPGLFEKLRGLRKELADAKNVPPYVVFSDVTLRHFSRDYPGNNTALPRVPGVGEKKLEDYGELFLKEIREWLVEHPRQDFTPLETLAAPPPRPPGITVGTAAVILELFRAGQSIAEIAKARDLAETTIESHLAQAIENGADLDSRRLYTAEEERLMHDALEGYDEPALKPVFEQLDGKISYGKLRVYRAMNPPLEIAE